MTTDKQFIVFPGAPFETSSLDEAEAFAERLVRGNDHLNHATIILVDKDWQDNSFVLEDRGLVFTLPNELTKYYAVATHAESAEPSDD